MIQARLVGSVPGSQILSQFCAGLLAAACAGAGAAGGRGGAGGGALLLEASCANAPAGSASMANARPAARSDLNVIDIPWGSRAIGGSWPPCIWLPFNGRIRAITWP